jgi:hypothetical protein
MKLELEAVGEQGLHHALFQLTPLLRREALHLFADVSLGLYIESARPKPRRPVEDLLSGIP